MRKLEHAVFLRDDEKCEGGAQERFGSVSTGTLRLFCWVFCLNLFSQESTFKKSYRKRNVSVFISGVPDGGRCEDRAGPLRPLQPVRLFPKPHRA